MPISPVEGVRRLIISNRLRSKSYPFYQNNYPNVQDSGRLWHILRYIPLVGSTWDLIRARNIVHTPQRWYSPWTARHRSRTRVWLRWTASVQLTRNSQVTGTRSDNGTFLNQNQKNISCMRLSPFYEQKILWCKKHVNQIKKVSSNRNPKWRAAKQTSFTLTSLVARGKWINEQI